jgi:hypothetical protein
MNRRATAGKTAARRRAHANAAADLPGKPVPAATGLVGMAVFVRNLQAVKLPAILFIGDLSANRPRRLVAAVVRKCWQRLRQVRLIALEALLN